MRRRYRNKLVLWEWSPEGAGRAADRRPKRKRSVARDAFTAALLLGAIIFFLSLLPASGDGYYRRDRLGRFMCDVVGTEPGTPRCAAVAIGGWFVIVVAVGVVLKVARGALEAVGIRSPTAAPGPDPRGPSGA